MKCECEICRERKDSYYQDHVNGKGMGFYELMHGDFSQQLRIPKKFTDFCKRLPLTVDLKGLSGSISPIGLHKTFNEVMMLHGWKEFVEVHNIQEKDLLLFKYDGIFSFHVSIYDESHCEKAPIEFFTGSKREKEQTSQDSVEILNVKSHHKVTLCSSSSSSHDDFLQSPTYRKAATNYHMADLSCKKGVSQRNEFPLHAENKKPKYSPDVDDQDTKDNIIHESIEIRNGGRVTRSAFYLGDFPQLKICMSRRRHLSGEEKKIVSQLVKAVQPKNPCFISFMLPSNVSNGCVLYIPADFQEHLPSTKCAIFLQVPHERKKWRVNLSIHKYMSRFCWESFVLENRLNVEDICLFVLIEGEIDITMTVHIHRAESRNNYVSSSSDNTRKTTQNRNASVSHKRARATRITRNNGCSSSACFKKFRSEAPACAKYNIKEEPDDTYNAEKLVRLQIHLSGRKHLTNEEEEQASQLARAVEPKNPCFMSVLLPGSVYSPCFLHIPGSFKKAHLPHIHSPSSIFLKIPGRTKKWCINLSVHKRMVRMFWKSFVVDNSLKVGDICLFELMKDQKHTVIAVHIQHMQKPKRRR